MNNFFKTVSFILIAFIFFAALEHIYDRKVINDDFVKPFWIFKHQNQSFDFAVLGSSQAQCNVNIFTMEQKLKQKGINLGIGGAAFSEQYLVLRTFLKTNKIYHLLLCVDIYGLDTSKYDYPFHEYNYLPFIDDEDIYKFIKDYCGYKAYIWKYIPFFKYAEFNSQIGLKNFLNLYFENKRFDAKGSFLLNKRLIADNLQLSDTYYEIHNARIKYLINIIELAKQNNIKVTFFRTPQFYIAYDYSPGYKEVFEFYQQMAKKYNLAYLEFDDYSINKNENYYVDFDHFNSKGAENFSNLLAKTLLQIK